MRNVGYNIAGQTPDAYEYEKGQLLVRPGADFVMTRDEQGEVKSLYGDDVYDYAAYDTRGLRTKIHISKNIPKTYQDDARWLFFLIERVATGRNNNNLGVNRLYGYFMGPIRALCDFSFQKNLSVFDVLSSKKLLAVYVNNNVSKKSFVSSFLPFCRHLIDLGCDKLGVKVALSDEIISRLKNLAKQHDDATEQTAVIPPRLYGIFVNQAWEVIAEYEQMREPFLNFITAIGNLPPNRHLKSEGGMSQTDRAKVILPFLENEHIKKVVKKYQWLSIYTGINRGKVSFYINNLQRVCKDLIHFYSGMRDSEASQLPYNSLSVDKHNNRKHARLLGYTFKYTGNKTQGAWVTTMEIERVVQVLQDIANVLVRYTDLNANKRFKYTGNLCPLFLSTGYLTNKCGIRTMYPKGVSSDVTKKIISNPLYDVEKFRVTEEDIKFLEMFEPERHWRVSEFAIGEIFKFKSHQFRRSLAVYSQQSGLVSIGSLQTQLHHLFRETSYYYANNAENCVFDASDSEHVAQEFARQKATADFAAYIQDILFSDEPLFGIAGKLIEHTIKPEIKNQRQWVLDNRKETEKAFKDGKIAHQNTPLGSCASTAPCDEKLTRNLLGCFGCKDACLKLSKVNKVIDRQTLLVAKINKSTVEYRFEKSEMDELIKERDRMTMQWH